MSTKRLGENAPDKVFERARETGVLTLDTEASSASSRTATPYFYSIASGKGNALKSAIIEPTREMTMILREFFANPEMRIIWHNKSYDMKFVHRFICPIRQVKAKVIDTMNLAWLYDNRGNSNVPKPLGLDALGQKYLKAGKTMSLKELFKKGPIPDALKALEKKAEKLKKRIPTLVKKQITKRKRRLRAAYATYRVVVDANTTITHKEKTELKREFRSRIDEVKDPTDRIVRAVNYRLKRLKQEYDKLIKKRERLFRNYARVDAEICHRLYYFFRKKLSERGMLKWADIERVVGDASTDAELVGFGFSPERLRLLDEKKIRPEEERLEHEMIEMGRQILVDANILSEDEAEDFVFKYNDGKTLSFILFNAGRALCTLEEGVQETARSIKDREKDPSSVAWYKTNRITLLYSADRDIFEETGQIERHPFAAKILEVRAFKKLREAFVNRLSKVKKRVHCLFRTSGTDTGRWTCKNPNLQQIPSRHKIGKLLRSAFVAKKDHVLIVADYSQVELRGIAHVCNEQNMLAEYKRFQIAEDGEKDYSIADLHQKTLDGIKKNCPPELHERTMAKISNFGLSYGMGSDKFARQFQVDPGLAYALRTSFFKEYPGIEDTIERFKYGWNSGIRKWRIPLTNRIRQWSKYKVYFVDGERRKETVHVAPGALLNTKVQGLCADILKAMLAQFYTKVVKHPRFTSVLNFIAQVHDEVIFEVHKDYALEVAKLLKYCMEFPWVKLQVPVLADVHIVDNWAEGKDGMRTVEDENLDPVMVFDEKKGKKIPLEERVYPEWNDAVKRCTREIREMGTRWFGDPKPLFAEAA